MATLNIRVTPTVVTAVPLNIVASAGWLANYSGRALISLTASGKLKSRIAIQGKALIGIVASGHITSPVAVSGTALISFRASGSIRTTASISAATAWGINLVTGGHFSYDNFAFNSFFRLGADYYV
jgi:hypothetical protein